MNLSQIQVAQWTLSHTVCTMLSHAMTTILGDGDEHDTMKDKHKEERSTRKVVDFEDRVKIRNEGTMINHHRGLMHLKCIPGLC